MLLVLTPQEEAVYPLLSNTPTGVIVEFSPCTHTDTVTPTQRRPHHPAHSLAAAAAAGCVLQHHSSAAGLVQARLLPLDAVTPHFFNFPLFPASPVCGVLTVSPS